MLELVVLSFVGYGITLCWHEYRLAKLKRETIEVATHLITLLEVLDAKGIIRLRFVDENGEEVYRD